MVLRTGKLPPELLKKLLRHRGAEDDTVVLGPAIGEDAAIVRLGRELIVLKTDPVTYASDMIGWYAVNVNANDVVTRGAKPAWFQAVVLLPPGSDEALAESIFKQISDAAKSLGIAVTGGHTEVTPGIDRPIVVGDMHGLLGRRKAVTTSGARVGDLLVMTKSAGIEGTAVIARERREELLRTFDRELVDRASKYLFKPGLSIVREAHAALEFGVSAMHDPTEGGVSMGVFEMAAASGKSFEFHPDKVVVGRETAMICRKYGLDPLGLLGSGALLATFRPTKADAYMRKLRGMGIDAAVIGRVIPGRGKSVAIVGGQITPLSSSERDEILKVLEP
ncbi:MAG: AIR synthase family protein [Candidatus Thermoplasmatota archaeon]|nr:AIR synthase family protein [Candidatus Thermoplasmatota archaeon]